MSSASSPFPIKKQPRKIFVDTQDLILQVRRKGGGRDPVRVLGMPFLPRLVQLQQLQKEEGPASHGHTDARRKGPGVCLRCCSPEDRSKGDHKSTPLWDSTSSMQSRWLAA